MICLMVRSGLGSKRLTVMGKIKSSLADGSENNLRNAGDKRRIISERMAKV